MKRLVFIFIFCLGFQMANLSGVQTATLVQQKSEVSLYLAEVRKQYDAALIEGLTPIQIVIGNEAADLDSIAAAIARAKYLSTDGVVYPVINIPRADLALRRDVEHLLNLLIVDPESLIFADEVPFEALGQAGRLGIHLVDHNAPALHQQHLVDHVMSIVDHHADEQVHYPLCSEENKTITTVGSAATLIVKDLIERGDRALNASWANLLLAPILIDTSNLQNAARTTQLDIEMVGLLKNMSDVDSIDAFYKQLHKLRADTEGFTPDMLLRKDLKWYQEGEITYSISAIPGGREYRWDIDGALLDAMQSFRSDHGIEFAMVMDKSPKHANIKRYRRLHVHCASQVLLDQLMKHFREDEALSKIMRLERVDQDELAATFAIPLTATRKVLQPQLMLGAIK